MLLELGDDLLLLNRQLGEVLEAAVSLLQPLEEPLDVFVPCLLLKIDLQRGELLLESLVVILKGGLALVVLEQCQLDHP